MFELNTIMRQQDSRIFADVLNRVREGHHSPDNLDLLRTRTISPDSPDNISDFEQSAQEKYIIQSVDTVVGAVSDDMAAHILTMIPANGPMHRRPYSSLLSYHWLWVVAMNCVSTSMSQMV